MVFLPTYLPTHPVDFWESVFLVGRGLGEEVLGEERIDSAFRKARLEKKLLPTHLATHPVTFGMHVYVCERKEM